MTDDRPHPADEAFEENAAITWALARHLRGEGPEMTPTQALEAYRQERARV